MTTTECLNDGSFGPNVRGCRDDFDFTQQFERIFFSIIPSCVFIGIALTRSAILYQRPSIVGCATFQYAKIIFTLLLGSLNLALLVLRTADSRTAPELSIAAALLSFCASLWILPLSWLEHEKSARPSSLICAYLLLTVLFDVVRARTAWLSLQDASDLVSVRLFTTAAAGKLFLLVLEAIPKSRWIFWDASEHSPEETSSIFSFGVYFWLNRLLVRGYKIVLGIPDLYPLDVAMHSSRLYSKLEKRMRVDEYKNNPKLGLANDLFRSLTGPLLYPVPPRIGLIGFKYCQPLFINSMLDYLTLPEGSQNSNIGYGLIGAAAFIYVGIAISMAFYDYFTVRAVYMIRGCLVSGIYRKTGRTKIDNANDSAALTLMSTDIDRVVKGGLYVHEMWANVVEIVIGCWLLYLKIGAAFVTPLVVISVCGGTLLGLVRLFGKRQSEWMAHIQNRVGLTANAISNMKLYKISGITGPVAAVIQNLRVKEIQVGNKFRWLILVAAVLGFSPVCLSPVLTFAVTSRSLSVSTIFTSISYIILVAAPLKLMLQYVPTILAGMSCIQRIQQFLVTESRIDPRSITHVDDERDERLGGASAFALENASFGWSVEKPTLRELNAKVPLGQVTLVVGPVASGKSTFCKALLGELPLQNGKITASNSIAHVAYCEQSPFLYNASLQENIIGHSKFDQTRYDRVIQATLLGPDIALLPQGHDTRIGSSGIMLSGGQKQRVTVARALYSEAKILIFDDVLSGLDADTESQLFHKVFGPDSWVRQQGLTVLICTHSVKHLPLADHIIALGDGTIVEQGSFTNLMKNNSYVQSLGVSSSITKGSENRDQDLNTATAKAMQAEQPEPATMDKSRQMGDWTVYKHYFQSVNTLSIVLLVATGLLYGFCNNFAVTWLKFWSEDSFEMKAGFYIGIYALLKVSQILCFLGNGITTFISIMTFAGTTLHQNAITTVVTAPLKFFSKTDSGVVTNLFSQDMTLIDGDLPTAFSNVTLDIADVIGMAFVIATGSPYLAIAYPILCAVLYFIQRFYLRTSRQMRLLDLEAKSPLYTHFMDTTRGVATLRALGWEKYEIEKNHRLLDTSQRPAYLLYMMQKWLMASLQLLVASLAVVLVSLATQLRTNAGLTGASLVTLLTFGETVSELIKYYTSLETSIGAVSRLRSFSDDVTPEDLPSEDIIPSQSWPDEGRIEINNVSASYETTETGSGGISQTSPKLVVRNLTLFVEPGQKVALCGRTGSGKSTMILLLLKLLDPLSHPESSIEIDKVPLHRIDRSTLRQRLIAIPQDAVFLPDGSTVKANIDPLDAATEDEALSALESVQLGAFVAHCGGLQGCMSADDLSAGQKQLFSLGRAILRKRVRDRLSSGSGGEKVPGGILLLDEVSSNVDVVTDRIMQEIIRAEFEAYTIIMVSHRLQMVVDFFDRVVVLDSGSVVETGSPAELIQTTGSRFGELWAAQCSG